MAYNNTKVAMAYTNTNVSMAHNHRKMSMACNHTTLHMAYTNTKMHMAYNDTKMSMAHNHTPTMAYNHNDLHGFRRFARMVIEFPRFSIFLYMFIMFIGFHTFSVDFQ